MQVNYTMKRPVGVQKPDRKSSNGVKRSAPDVPLQYHPAPVPPASIAMLYSTVS